MEITTGEVPRSPMAAPGTMVIKAITLVHVPTAMVAGAASIVIIQEIRDQGKSPSQRLLVQNHPETHTALLEIHLHQDQVVQAQKQVVPQKALHRTILHQDRLLLLKNLTDGDNQRAF